VNSETLILETPPPPSTSGPDVGAQGPPWLESAMTGWSTATAVVRGVADRVIEQGDENPNGWNRNLALLAWVPFFSLLPWLMYLVVGERMSRTTRSHVIMTFNLVATMVYLVTSFTVLALLHEANTFLALLFFVFFAAVQFVLGVTIEARDGHSAGRFIWLGVFTFLALVTALGGGLVAKSSPDIVDYGSFASWFFWLLASIFMVVNAFRGRVGARPVTFGIPLVPVLSQR
jgi:hypothetical protein